MRWICTTFFVLLACSCGGESVEVEPVPATPQERFSIDEDRLESLPAFERAVELQEDRTFELAMPIWDAQGFWRLYVKYKDEAGDRQTVILNAQGERLDNEEALPQIEAYFDALGQPPLLVRVNAYVRSPPHVSTRFEATLRPGATLSESQLREISASEGVERIERTREGFRGAATRTFLELTLAKREEIEGLSIWPVPNNEALSKLNRLPHSELVEYTSK